MLNKFCIMIASHHDRIGTDRTDQTINQIRVRWLLCLLSSSRIRRRRSIAQGRSPSLGKMAFVLSQLLEPLLLIVLSSYHFLSWTSTFLFLRSVRSFSVHFVKIECWWMEVLHLVAPHVWPYDHSYSRLDQLIRSNLLLYYIFMTSLKIYS